MSVSKPKFSAEALAGLSEQPLNLHVAVIVDGNKQSGCKLNCLLKLV